MRREYSPFAAAQGQAKGSSPERLFWRRRSPVRSLCPLALLAVGWCPARAGFLEDTSGGLEGYLEHASADLGWHGIETGWLQVEDVEGLGEEDVDGLPPDGRVGEERNISQECKAAQWDAFLHLAGVWEGEWQCFHPRPNTTEFVPTVSYNATMELRYDPVEPGVVRETMSYQLGFEPPSDIGEVRDGLYVVNATPIVFDNFTEPERGRIRSVSNNFTYVFGHDSFAAGTPVLSFELGIRRDGWTGSNLSTERRRAVFVYDNSEDPLELMQIIMIWEARPDMLWYNRSVGLNRRLVADADSFFPPEFDGPPTVTQTRYSLDCGSEVMRDQDHYIPKPTFKLPGQEFHFWAPQYLERNASTQLGIGWEDVPWWARSWKMGRYLRNVMVFEQGKLKYLATEIVEVTNKQRFRFDSIMAVFATLLLVGALICGCARRETIWEEDDDEEGLELVYGSY